MIYQKKGSVYLGRPWLSSSQAANYSKNKVLSGWDTSYKVNKLMNFKK